MSFFPALVDSCMGEPLDALYPQNTVRPASEPIRARPGWGEPTVYNPLNIPGQGARAEAEVAAHIVFGRFQASVDVSRYEPEHINVRFENGLLTVEGVVWEIDNNMPARNTYHHQFRVPDIVDMSLMTRETVDGTLTVRAPLYPIHPITGQRVRRAVFARNSVQRPRSAPPPTIASSRAASGFVRRGQ